MANKVILGKSTNSNIGHSSATYGLWAARAGEEEVTDCTKDQLVMNTETIGNASGAIDIGQFQVIPSTGTTASQQVSIAGGASSTVSYVNLGTSSFVQGYFSRGSYSVSGSSLSQFMNIASYGGATSVSMSNGGATAITGQVTTWKGFSTDALF